MNAVKKSWDRAYFFHDILQTQHTDNIEPNGTKTVELDKRQTANIIRSWLATNPKAVTAIDAAMNNTNDDNQSLQEWCDQFNQYHRRVIQLKKRRLYEKNANKRRRNQTLTEPDTEYTLCDNTPLKAHYSYDMPLLIALKDIKKIYNNQQIIQACDALDSLLDNC